MRANDQVKNCVAFLATDRFEPDGTVVKRMRGTAFFVVTGENPYQFQHLVTARHVIDNVIKLGCERMYIRVNLRDGGSDYTPVDPRLWRHHPTADVSVLPCTTFSRDHYDVISISNDMLLDGEIINEQNIGVGDDVLVTGLFSEHFGTNRNIPIVRVGTLAAMPEEPILSSGKRIDAYLVEARSMGGISGSPVFVHLVAHRATNALVTSPRKGRDMYLLGVMHGHWDRGTSTEDVVEDEAGLQEVNMGIAIVTPSSKIVEAIDAALRHPGGFTSVDT